MRIEPRGGRRVDGAAAVTGDPDPRRTPALERLGDGVGVEGEAVEALAEAVQEDTDVAVAADRARVRSHELDRYVGDQCHGGGAVVDVALVALVHVDGREHAVVPRCGRLEVLDHVVDVEEVVDLHVVTGHAATLHGRAPQRDGRSVGRG